MFRNFIAVVCCVLSTLIVVTVAFSQFADSPWPMSHQGRSLAKLTTQRGPEGPSASVQQKWFREFGQCVFPPSQGSDEWLYLAIEEKNYPNDHYLYRINPNTGANDPDHSPARLGHFIGDDAAAASCTPLLVKTGSTDWVYTQQRGLLEKWSTSLVKQWEVTIKHPDGTDLLPSCFNLSNNDETLIASAGENLSNSSKTLLFAINKESGTKNTFDLYQWVMDRRCLTQTCVDNNLCTYGSECFIYLDTTVTVNNTVSVGPDPSNANFDLVYVIIRESFLFAVRFHKANKTWGSPPIDPVKWKVPYSPNQSGTSPTVSFDGDWVYFVTGKEAGVTATLYSVRTSDGEPVAHSTFDVGKVQASLVVETVNGKNRIYAHNLGQSLMGFEDDLLGDTLDCMWRTASSLEMMKAANGKSVGTGQAGTGLLYAGYQVSGSTSRYAAAFDPDANWGGGTGSPCKYTNGNYVWRRQMGTTSAVEDNSGRAIGKIGPKGQVYFCTNTKLFSFENL